MNRGTRLERIAKAKSLLSFESPDGEILVLKDPKICRLLTIWLPAIQDSGMAASVILASRNPNEVAASLLNRNGISRSRSNLLWLQHMSSAEGNTRHLPRTIVNYDMLLSDWRSVLAHAGDDLGFDSIELSGDIADSIDRFIKPDLCHHKSNTDKLLKTYQKAHL